jgi:uncharacterized protein (TIGR04255 family)
METFRNPPITEALIDIRAELQADISLAHLTLAHERIKSHYPKKKVRQRVQGSIVFTGEEGQGPRTESKVLDPDGYIYWSQDDTQAVQFRLDGFTFSRMRPYKDWDSMRSEAAPLWELYVQMAKPTQVTRVAVRYINSIEVPAESFILEEYFTTPPKVPQGIPQTVEQFLTRLVMSFPEYDSKAVVTLATKAPSSPTMTPILLDIDVFRQIRLSPTAEEMWSLFSNLRKMKNDIFLSFITEKTKELFR